MLNKFFGPKKPKYFLELKEDDNKTNGAAPVIAPAQPEVTEPAAVESAPAPKETPKNNKSKKTSIKKDKPKKEEAAPAPAPVAKAATNGKVEPQEVEFASKYLLTPTMSRRRPGPSLNPFKDMAKQVKTPGNRG